ncbi:MAG: BspA family leucine-rich repeat surface protein, partial [Alphaproteobacteria bacterium]|nr:BspA family leucine-rich repeat surface protein [Alphaproteobacteria bacterium]
MILNRSYFFVMLCFVLGNCDVTSSFELPLKGMSLSTEEAHANIQKSDATRSLESKRATLSTKLTLDIGKMLNGEQKSDLIKIEWVEKIRSKIIPFKLLSKEEKKAETKRLMEEISWNGLQKKQKSLRSLSPKHRTRRTNSLLEPISKETDKAKIGCLKKVSIVEVPTDKIIELTLVVPGEINGQDVVLLEYAFSNLNARNIKVHLRFEERNGKKVLIRNGYNMFSNSTSIYSFDFRGLDTSRMSNMNSMFAGCKNITSLDLSHFDTKQIEYADNDLKGAFYNCIKLQKLDITSFKNDQKADEVLVGMFQDADKNISEPYKKEIMDYWLFYNQLGHHYVDVKRYKKELHSPTVDERKEQDKFNINSGEKEDLTVMQKLPSIMMKRPEKKRAGGYITKERREEIIPKKKQSSSICYITKALQPKPTKLPVPENARFTKSFVIRSEQKSGEGLNGG